MGAYPILKFIHILAAIAALGANLTYLVLLERARRQPESLLSTLQAIRFLDRRLANPAYGLVLAAGLALLAVMRIPLTTPWVLAALVLYGLIAVLGVTVYAPVFRRQVRLAETGDLASPAYRSSARLAGIFALLMTGLTVLIVFLMVVKPGLWGALG